MIDQYLQEIEQPHLGWGLESLSAAERHAFLHTLQKYGPHLSARQKALLSAKVNVDLSSMQPLSRVARSGSLSDRILGEKLIAEGKVGCLILAGGQGTRLGHEGPKGTLPITAIKNKSLFQLFAERTLCAGKRANRSLPLAIMTSPLNDRETRAFVEQHAFFGLSPSQLFFFSQEMLPLIDKQGNWLLTAPGQLALGPDGNGNALERFYKQGIWQEWQAMGVEYLNVLFVDNPLADPFDAEFIGFAARSQLDIGMKLVERLSTEEKMGVAVLDKDRLKIVEYSEFLSENSAGYSLASPGLFVFGMPWIRSLYEEKNTQLPLHLAHKTASVIAPGTQAHVKMPVYKCETFQFDLLDYTTKSAAILYPRMCTYAPVKNAIGDKSQQAARDALLAFDRQIYAGLSGLAPPSFSFELDPAFYYPTEEMKQRMRGRALPCQGYIDTLL